jgi:Tn3 transposase DDE domain
MQFPRFAVAASGFGPGVSHELGDQDEVVAVADEPGAEGVAQHVAAEAGIEAGFGGDGQQDVVGAVGGQAARNVIDWRLIERHWQDLMQVAISISEGRLSSATLMRRLRSNSRKNRIYKVFREVGRSVRTVALLRYLADPQLRARITAATNKVESYNGFSHWLAFGNNGVLADNDPAEQEKLIKLNTLLANLVIFHNALDIMDVVRKLVAEGWLITADQLGAMSPYLRGHISRFGAYATDDLARQPEAFNPVLKEVDFTALGLAA